jgi:hypothetical protein
MPMLKSEIFLFIHHQSIKMNETALTGTISDLKSITPKALCFAGVLFKMGYCNHFAPNMLNNALYMCSGLYQEIKT